MENSSPNENWHADFNPRKFLSRVNLAQLIERNEAYNESFVVDAKSPCILCNKICPQGILLNDKSFLCQSCYTEVALISYPEKYEKLRRQFKIEAEARRIAWKEFSEKFKYIYNESGFVYLGWLSFFLVFVHIWFIGITLVLLAIGYEQNSSNKRKAQEWHEKQSQWEKENPAPAEPVLKHFHDPNAELTSYDRTILKIFDHWPGYPPFWEYLRTIVLIRDSNRCQVTGCPSRLELHVHHKRPVSNGGTHSPDNLISLCSFHHALEPDKGHERIWGNVNTNYFTMVCAHERNYRTRNDVYQVRAHLRRLELIRLNEIRELVATYGFCCPTCSTSKLKFTLYSSKNIVVIDCPNCNKTTEAPQQLTEETGPFLAEILQVTRNCGKWKARWDMLEERKQGTWGTWKDKTISERRKKHREKIDENKQAPTCPKCGAPMKLVVPRHTDKWKTFWGCTQYPVTGCKGSKKHNGRR